MEKEHNLTICALESCACQVHLLICVSVISKRADDSEIMDVNIEEYVGHVIFLSCLEKKDSLVRHVDCLLKRKHFWEDMSFIWSLLLF